MNKHENGNELYPVLGAVPFLNEPTNSDWRDAVKQLPSACVDLVVTDPPYEGVFGYKDKFDHELFWNWCRAKAEQGHKVFVSEYNAPKDFECIWSAELKTNMNAKHTTKPIEKLFTPMVL